MDISPKIHHIVPSIVHGVVQGPNTGSCMIRRRRRTCPWSSRGLRGVSSYSDRVKRVLETPELETPEGMSADKMFEVAENFWKAMRRKKTASSSAAPTVISRVEGDAEMDVEYDVCVCGGTLGIFVACVLQQQGIKTCLVEKRAVEGRTQEWNISKNDYYVLEKLGVLTRDELESCIATKWSHDRIAFHNSSKDIWVSDALDLGIYPRALIALLKEKFLEHGGHILENTMFRKATVYDDCVDVSLHPTGASAEHWTAADMNRPGEFHAHHAQPNNKKRLTCRIVVDCMGHYSSIVKQMRHGQREDGMVIVVGGCMYPGNEATQQQTSADLLVTIDDSKDDMQYFWESFPAEGGRMQTVYMFAYSDADSARPDFADIFDTYLTQLETYQHVDPDAVRFKRILLGGFPCYATNAPLKPTVDRVLQVGDASAVQNPLSFGGFASLCRHLPRVTRGIRHAIESKRTTKKDLAWITPYLPNLSVAFLFQRAMSLKPGQQQKPPHAGGIPANHINKVMRCNFSVMSFFGPSVMHPFIQDSFQAGPLALVMLGMMFRDPVTIVRVLFQLGPLLILQWMGHFACLILYTVLHILLSPFRGLFKGYVFQRICDALEWGSGLDHGREAASPQVMAHPNPSVVHA